MIAEMWRCRDDRVGARRADEATLCEAPVGFILQTHHPPDLQSETPVLYRFAPLIAGIAFFLVLLAFIELGRKAGRRRLQLEPEGPPAGEGTVEGAVFAMLGLLLAFTFSGAAARFDERRDLIVAEANIIGTAYLRLDVLPVDSQPALRESFRRYLDSRIATYAQFAQGIGPGDNLERSLALQQTIWNQAVAGVRASGSPAATTVVLPAINEMIDIVTTRTMSTKKHPPWIIFALLFAVAMIASFFAGRGMSEGTSRHHLHTFGFALVVAFTLYVVIELEFPRFGMIQVTTFDQVLVALRASWG